jgi:hypothetical protein
VLCVFGVGFVCPNSLYVFFVSCSEVSTCLPYVSELAIFEFHLVYAPYVVYVCGITLWLQVVLYCVFCSVCYVYVGVF